MPFKLLLSEEISPAVRRMALEQLARARRSLSAANNLQAGVHQARKCMKRTRSLLRLSRPIVGEGFYKKQNRACRDIGRALAGPRAAGALLETVIRFEASSAHSSEAPLLRAVKAKLLSDKSTREEELEIVALGSLIERLDEASQAWKETDLPSSSFADLAGGFGVSYLRGQKSLKRAIRRNETFYLHEWRKDVQQCWRQMQILTLIWPEDIMPRIRLAREISKLLGTEHDIAELLDYIKTHKKELDRAVGDAQTTKLKRRAFFKASKAIQRDLCLHAVERGRRLYAIESSALVEAMTIYWRTGTAMHPMPGVVRVLADIDEEDRITPSHFQHWQDAKRRPQKDG